MTRTTTSAEPLRTTLRGSLVEPTDPTYEQARTLWNAAIDRRPAYIAQCVCVDDVVAALGFARAAGLEITIRGSWHSASGWSSVDDGPSVDELNAWLMTALRPRLRTRSPPGRGPRRSATPRTWSAAVGAQGADQVVDLAGRDAVQVGLHHHGEQRLIHPTAAFQQRWEERARPQFRDPHPRPESTAAGVGGRCAARAGVGALVRGGVDHRGELSLDQRLVDGFGSVAYSVAEIGGLECLENFEQGRVIQGHRVSCPSARTFESVSLTVTRWPSRPWSPRRQDRGSTPRPGT